MHLTPDGAGRTTVSLVHCELHRHGQGWEGLRAALADDGGWPGIMRAYATLAGAHRRDANRRDAE